jgi:hypothetical protein
MKSGKSKTVPRTARIGHGRFRIWTSTLAI